MTRLRTWLRQAFCPHTHERDCAVNTVTRGDIARVRWCPACLRTRWVD